MATDSLFKITKSVCEWDYTRYNRKKIKYVLHVEKKK